MNEYESYKNLSGNSGVQTYKIEENSISVQFLQGSAYLYDYDKPEVQHVENMKELAEKGRGLSTYISQKVRDRYSAKLR